MTIRNNYCESCQGTCFDDPRVCTVCGATLVAPPTPPPRIVNNNDRSPSTSGADDNGQENSTENDPRVRVADMYWQTAATLQQLRTLVNDLRQHIRTTGEAQRVLMQELQQRHGQWAMLPPTGLLDGTSVTQQFRPSSRPVSKSFMEHKMKAIVLQENSAILHQAIIKFDKSVGLNEMTAIPGEFGAVSSLVSTSLDAQLDIKDAHLIIANPRTLKGGRLSETTISQVKAVKSCEKDNKFIMYFDRGDGVTFVQKAIVAQEIGACAVIIGNHVNDPWPYIMKDSTNEATKLGLTIPVVMISQSNAQNLLNKVTDYTVENIRSSLLLVSLSLHCSARDCVICTETLQTNDTVIQVPDCAHVFHQACAQPWFESHHTCPYCRLELPTDDVDFDRRRTANLTNIDDGTLSSDQFYT